MPTWSVWRDASSVARPRRSPSAPSANATSRTDPTRARSVLRAIPDPVSLAERNGLDTEAMSLVLVDRPRPHVSVVTLNRPERLNAMSIDLVIELHDRLDEVAADNDCWVVVLTGS